MTEAAHRMYRAISDDHGQDMIEYALIMGLISVVALASVILAGDAITGLWETISTSIPAI